MDFVEHYHYKGEVNEAERARNRIKSTTRAWVEHSIGVIKRIFGFVKVRYCGLEKNANRLFVSCALTNSYLVRRQLSRTFAGVVPMHYAKGGLKVTGMSKYRSRRCDSVLDESFVPTIRSYLVT